MKHYSYALPAILLLMFFYSCKEESDIPVNGTTNNLNGLKNEITVQNERLVFSNGDVFYKTSKELNNSSPEELVKWESQFKFKSIRNIHSFSDDTLLNFHAPTFIGSVLNHRGEYQIGDSLIWITGNNVFVIPNKNEDLLKEIQQSNDFSKYEEFRQDFLQPAIFENINVNEKSLAFGPDGFACSNGFNLPNKSHLFRWVWQYNTVYSGSRYWLTINSHMSYRSGKHWYLAGELIHRRAVYGWQISAYSTVQQEYVASTETYNTNGYFKITPYSSLYNFYGNSLSYYVDSNYDQTGNYYNVNNHQVSF